MKRILAYLMLLGLAVGATSCNDDDDRYYLSVSGDGALTVNYSPPLYLGRMVVLSTDVVQETYLMGGSAYVGSGGGFAGRGATVHISSPNIDDSEALVAQSFNIDNDEYIVEYSTYIDFDRETVDENYTALESGTVVIRRAGSLYDIQILGKDSDGDNIIISYRGYIYRSFIDD